MSIEKIIENSESNTDAFSAAVEGIHESVALLRTLINEGKLVEALAFMDEFDAKAESIVLASMKNTEHEGLFNK